MRTRGKGQTAGDDADEILLLPLSYLRTEDGGRNVCTNVPSRVPPVAAAATAATAATA